MNSLEFAINMEHDGEKFYRKQAEINKDNSLKIVFLMLAEDEKRHGEILENKGNELAYKLIDSKILSGAKNVFKGIGNFKKEFKDIPNQLDAYRFALEKESQSIDLYKKLSAEAKDDPSRELFEYLVGQEKDHFTTLEELVKIVQRPEEWVEDAEFGIREEY